MTHIFLTACSRKIFLSLTIYELYELIGWGCPVKVIIFYNFFIHSLFYFFLISFFYFFLLFLNFGLVWVIFLVVFLVLWFFWWVFFCIQFVRLWISHNILSINQLFTDTFINYIGLHHFPAQSPPHPIRKKKKGKNGGKERKNARQTHTKTRIW